MLKRSLLLSLLLLMPLSVFANDKGIAQLYHDAGVEGAILIRSLDGQQEFQHNAPRFEKGYLPASTFKIPNTLIALEEGIITPDQTIKWDGVKRGYKPWNQDQTLATAFARSCVWCYQEFARKLGDKKYKDYLAAFDYGNHQTGDDIARFWLDGDLKISHRQQLDFMHKVYHEQLPVKSQHFKTLKEIMLVEETPEYQLRVKTGWTGKQGWYVGYVETKAGVWLFANHMEVSDMAKLKLRKKLTMDSLKLKGIL